ncbi:23S rRNA (uracil(1939)-C(5))-methyltransferase RlmD [Flavobacteriaceae bacterium]|jgi:23S rRNA (uracil1939-C5)-methyltransferase|nr:23S rRNA (uracil(1939)-C(5))-methyltransferase RlmD [Flavobacteriaceae bacterium]MDA9851795.1 23S rRNA (uracil(1939)-C(5))-methyltransferase RlmD [Flavobacteriaceae bacterium]MDC0872414.1 23S rRNA (uracil(1939)-C(5))-methyltransferase RlmD [Flavobacteriaceae bacterium]
MGRKRVERFENDLKVIDINAKGMGVAKTAEGAVCFIKKVVPGDIVDVRIYKKRRGYFEAEPTRWIQKSKQRTEPVCDHFGVCGGCKWQHLSYQGQIDFKEKGVVHNLKHIGKVEVQEILPIAGVTNPYYYRNKMEFSFSNNRWLTMDEIQQEATIERNGLGFHKPGMWDKIVDVHHCHLQADPSNEIRNALRTYALENQLEFFDPRNQSGFLRTLMIRNTQEGEVMVLLQFYKEHKKNREAILDFIVSKFPQLTSLLYCINTKPNDSIYDQDIHCYHGQDYITENLDQLQFKITAKSFYQTNPQQAKVLYKIAKDFAALKPNEVVYDLYTGTGTIALSLAASCAKIIGIESVPEAIDAAQENALVNQIQNAHFEVGDMKAVFNDSFISRHGKADVVITDPPRDGMHADVVQQLIKLAPKRIVYISCNSATQARDLNLMKSHYEVLKSQAVDMFPQTHHVENVVLLELKTTDE